MNSEPEEHDASSKNQKVFKKYKLSKDLLASYNNMQQVNIFEGNQGLTI